jgi:dTDP-glucose 4,6-dehydratase
MRAEPANPARAAENTGRAPDGHTRQTGGRGLPAGLAYADTRERLSGHDQQRRGTQPAMSTLLVTGAAGFIGSNFVRYWRERHHDDRVVALDALTYAGSEENLADLLSEVTFVHGDIRDQDLIERLLREHGVEVIVNFAAESHNSLAILRPGEFFATNVMGTQSLLEAARRVGVARFHQISTCEVYGDMGLDDPGAFTEDSPYLPRTPYNAAKAGGDHAVRAYHHTYDLPVTITNCSNNYGPYQFPEKVIPLFVTRALQGQALPLYASTKNRREWLHVQDHCRAIDLVLERGRVGETYHVGSGVEADIDTIADLVLAELGLPSSLKTIVPDRPSHDRRYLLDSGKLRTELGWAPEIGFAEGLKGTVAWYRDNEAWWRPLIGRSPVEETRWS